MPTQLDDIQYMLSREDVPNFSEPGTGKTLTTIGAINSAKLASGLIVCPTIATTMWQETLEHELGAKAQHLKTRSTAIDKTADFWVASYGVIADHAEELKRHNLGALVVDESHYIKSKDAQRTQVIMGEECDGSGGLYERSTQCWLLTGTPVERYSDDLWSQLRATQPYVLEHYGALTLEQFQRRFCRMEWKEYANGKIKKYVSVGNQSMRLLNQMLYSDIGVIRRTMKDVEPYMPEVRFREIFTKAKVTAELKSLLVGKSEKEIIEMLLAGGDKIVRARRLMGMAKVTEVRNYIASIATDKQVLVGFWHEEVGKELYKQLTAASFATNLVYGATSQEARERIKARFMNGEIDILVGQMQAMGVAWDGLQKTCSHVILAEDDWSSAKIEQFYKRVARKGQRHSVQVDFCNSLEAVDTAVKSIREDKRMQTKEILDAS